MRTDVFGLPILGKIAAVLSRSGAHYSLSPRPPSSIAAKQEEANGFHRLRKGEGGYDTDRWERLRDVSSVGH
jgi:hypothetical protein